ncbi:hypothetical protein A2926_02765 [Candidatus Giovannonibacteria bacterium RIFCSPLOWO2_01_FULL_44_40]|uniref:Amidohydrolase 3 domain-containing protein n=1 Tax=Candidatus Giovannonibacteria bacterium RIFCSPHIGHO2_01_FULL_45_23 TaxID=1798325 RepID=A0A1F5VE79_9BACT|nr:MAG: hypothetical protein A2834_00885 [Candidatus Giovannonibacteria bacterium RIFCSPHIGHO2_01_FULL_45_23]OGF75261.1 MAG: hypothetical protein A3C77_02695 [Candidatus Giovannonibacteria bacterium RIFCSPHIGHO2_02_FULL_45_13]OGF79935.1 MAG: hypothetical protein A2926_02765 [Candidatus Giovannonibacteria bacterium RIFCSPLOWO2_01_FULL_44_40]
MALSILIKNGTVIDGSGKEPVKADVGISANRIVKIGDLSKETANQVIDAANLYITPGFIDLTNHSDVYGSLFTVPSQESMLRQGVTTVLLGNCGESLALVANKESLTDLERWTTGFSIPINWNSVEEYYKNIENLGVGLNVATLVGQETLKRNAGTPEERIFLLEKAMDEGAWGLSSNFSFAEWGPNFEGETLNLLKIVAKHGGLYKIHLRDEGKNFLPAVAFAISLARTSGARTCISHFKAIGRGAWADFNKALRMLQQARKEGINISFDFSPYLRTGSMLVSLLPAWARQDGNEEILKKLYDPDTSLKIINDLKAATLHADKIFIASAFRDKTAVGKTLADLVKHTGLPAENLILELLKINNLNVSIFGKTISSQNLLSAAKDEAGLVSSDGAGYDVAFQRFGDLVHPRSFGAYPRFFNFISQKAGVSAGEAVAKMTSRPAAVLGLKDRGVLKTDYIADIAVFHPKEFKDQSVYKNPYNYSAGLHFLIIAGHAAISNGVLEPKKYGAALRKTN